ncbi:hypothetical protein WJX72_010974 [[Myrmecia] bisecta]|uniref:ER-bound oxygenase mpaB/mpaB'/Rubber oxygenase catalytic domain-containing protein n=1 Tax=[Myrmecia] bisecta TaxID=41462 RepID=A0AAW1P6I4_9CHLO
MAGVTSRARAATAEARRSDDADPSCSSTTLSAEEYAQLLEAAMRYPDQQVGLCVAAMVSVSLTAGFRSDDLQDTRYFMELVATVPAVPLPMQVLAIAHNGGKANQDGQTTYAALANHKQPQLDSLSYLAQHILHQINVSKLPLLQLIFNGDTSWRSYRMFLRDPSTATSKQTYYDVSTMLLKVIATMSNPLVKTKITHLMRCSGLADLAAAGCSMDVMRVWGRWAAADGVIGKSYLPKSPLSALSATVESILYLAETFWQSSPFMLQRYGLSWWALQLPAVRTIVGSYAYRVFEQEVLQAELHWSARPLSPQLTEAFGKIKKQSLTEWSLSMLRNPMRNTRRYSKRPNASTPN